VVKTPDEDATISRRTRCAGVNRLRLVVEVLRLGIALENIAEDHEAGGSTLLQLLLAVGRSLTDIL
jgi:hypothetical protein